MPETRMPNFLPLNFLFDSFKFLFKVIDRKPFFPDENDEQQLLKYQSFATLTLKIKDEPFPLTTLLVQLALSAILLIGLIDSLAYFLIKIISPAEPTWTIRNLCFISMIAIGLGSILLICVNVGAGLYCMIKGNIISLLVFITASINPSLKILHFCVYSKTLDQLGLSYTMGGFVIGVCLVLFATWFKSSGFMPEDKLTSSIKTGKALANLLFIVVLLIGYSFLEYFMSQEFPGDEHPNIFIAMLVVPSVVVILIRFNLTGGRIDWKDLLLLVTPVITFFGAVFSIYKFLCDHYFHKQYPHAASGIWIEGAGLGILIGIIVGSYFLFVQLIVGLILKSLTLQKFKENLIVISSTVFTWLSCSLIGEFSHLNPENKPYITGGLIFGIMVGFSFFALPRFSLRSKK